MYYGFLVVDDFYPNPDEVRSLALQDSFQPPAEAGVLAGDKSHNVLWTEQHAQFVSRLVGMPVRATAGSDNGNFWLAGRDARRGNAIGFGAAPDQIWTGICCLDPAAACFDGDRSRVAVSFWRHRRIGSERIPRTVEEAEAQGFTGLQSLFDLVAQDGGDESRWEKLTSIPLRYNRLILFRPWMWHSMGETFGDSRETSRLTQSFALSQDEAASPRAD